MNKLKFQKKNITCNLHKKSNKLINKKKLKEKQRKVKQKKKWYYNIGVQKDQKIVIKMNNKKVKEKKLK